MSHWGVKAYELNRLCILNWHRTGGCIGQMNWYEFVWLWFLRIQPHLTTAWSRSHCRHFGLSSDNIKCLHMLSKCCRGWWGCRRVYSGLDSCQNLQFGGRILHISPMNVVGCIPRSQLGKFVKPHRLLPNPLHAVLYCFGDCAHHPAVLSSSLSLPCSVSSSLSSLSSPSCSLSELERLLRPSSIAFNISSNAV